MAGNWYRDEDRGGNRHRGAGDHGDGNYGGDRGFFERAGEEVRSWFGDNESEHRHSGSGRRDMPRDEPWGGGDWAGSGGRSSGGSGRDQNRGHAQSWGEANDGNSGQGSSPYGGSQSQGGRYGSHPDDHYRSWRERQIEQMDREYEDYCRERQQSFHNDFHTWRENRQSQSGISGGSGLGTSASTGSTGGGLAAGSGGTTGGEAATGSTGSTDESGAGAGGGTPEGATEKAGSRSKA